MSELSHSIGLVVAVAGLCRPYPCLVGGAAGLPSGVVTFLLTDVGGSTALWENAPSEMGAAMARHDAVIEGVVDEWHGVLVRPKGEGDSRFAVFARASDAVAAAAAMVDLLRNEVWATPRPIRVRVAVHSGEAEIRADDYYGTAVNRCARIRSLAHPGQVLVSQATVQLVSDVVLGGGFRLVDRGVHRLRDLGRPERLYELVTESQGDDFPPLVSLDKSPQNLPTQLTNFVGREREMAAVAATVEAHRLVTLTGPPGVGKTRLAMQVAADVIDRFPEGVWLVDLAPVGDPALVAHAFAGAFNVREAHDRTMAVSVAEHLRHRQLLLVLDNCEHVIDAAAELVDRIVRQAPGVHVLATSQEPLGLAGEAVHPVPSLAVPDLSGRPSREVLSGIEAMRLFIDRAGLVRPDFEVTDENAAIVAEICARLDGIPLAIELAAARVSALTPNQISARLDDRFRLLSRGGRRVPMRHQTLWAAIEWSHQLLTPHERVLLRRLAAFVGTFSLEAVEVVCGSDPLEAADVVDLLTVLVDKSLVVTTDQGRYRLMETIRSFADEQLAVSGERVPMHGRHLDWAVGLCAGIGPALEEHGEDEGKAFAVLAIENDNLVTAINRHLRGDRKRDALSVLCEVAWLWDAQGRLLEHGWRQFGELLADVSFDTALRAKALLRAGNIAIHRGDYTNAEQLYAESAAAAEQTADGYVVETAMHNAAQVALFRGDLDGAEQLVIRGIEAAGSDRARMDVLLSSLHALIEILRGAPEAGEQLLSAQPTTNVMADAERAHLLGLIALIHGDAASSRTWLEKAVQLHRQLPFVEDLVFTLSTLGTLHRLERHDEAAGSVLGEAVALARQSEDRRSLAIALHALGKLKRHSEGDSDPGAAFAEALRLRHDLGDAYGTPVTIAAIGCLSVERGHASTAITLLAAAHEHLDRIGAALLPWDHDDVRHALGAANSLLDESEVAANETRGRELSLEQAVTLALHATA